MEFFRRKLGLIGSGHAQNRFGADASRVCYILRNIIGNLLHGFAEMELKHIVASYIQRFRQREQCELEWYRNQPSLVAAIETAALAIDCRGKRQLHQRRFARSTLEKGRDALMQIRGAIRRAKSFDELHSLIEDATLPIKGINELYIYDTALRIGAKRNLLPTKVYLHRGTRQGARALGFWGKGPLRLSELPKELRRLPAHEIEDILCIYKDYFDESRTIVPETIARRGCAHSNPRTCRGQIR